ncbi:FAD-binding protein [Sphingomonas oligophenolica]|uniref:FAD-binding protein n=1 Tax=Sphingomonas oligophenolica TaxID=301154 RepID=A0ABU9YBH1_9SPHN
MLTPRDTRDLAEIVASAAADGTKLELSGGGTKTDFGAPRQSQIVALRQIAGIVDYDSAELVLTVRPGTSLAEIDALIAAEGQMLAFEPWGDPAATIGGTVAAGVAGSRRVTAGSARDHLLGFTAVSGRGQTFVAGAKVVKNVTGYDLPKLMAGSWGRLGAMTEITLKVLPRPRQTVTLAARSITPEGAYAVMACALGSNADVSAAAALPTGEVLLRVAGFAASVEARCVTLPRLLAGHCSFERMPEEEAAPLWRKAMSGDAVHGDILWDVHLPPRYATGLIKALEPLGINWSMDWGGGRLWIGTDERGGQVRDEAAKLGGEAKLARAPAEMRAHIPVFHPRQSGVAMLEQRVRRAFDPAGVFVTGRFMEDADADQFPA